MEIIAFAASSRKNGNTEILLDEVITDEQDAYDNMLENLQESEKSESMDEGLDTLDEAKGLLEELIS